MKTLIGLFLLIQTAVADSTAFQATKGDKTVALMAAIIIFIFSMLMTYIAWYVLWGRHRREMRKEKKQVEEGTTENKKDGKVRWGISKDSYCYPTINDILGYEFIKVIKVPDEGKEEKQAPEEEKKQDGRTWRATVVSANSNGQIEHDDEGNIINEPIESPIPEEEQKEPAGRLDNEEIEKSETGFSDDELEDLDEYSDSIFSPWPDNDPPSYLPDEEYEELISNNADRIQEVDEPAPGMENEQETEKLLFQQLQENAIKQEEQMEKNRDKVNQLWDDLESEPDPKTEPEE